MKILAIDSSGLVASAAIVEDDSLLAEYTINYKKTHSQTLLPMLDEVVKMIDLDLTSIDAIAVAGGPGSFTGLRIGSATAKGLGLALEKPLIQVPTVDGLAYNLAGGSGLVCPLMDARRNQTYTGLYEFQGFQMKTLLAQCAVSIRDIVDTINRYENRNVVFLGDGVPVFSDYLKEHCQIPYTFAPAHLNRQRAAAVAVLGMEYFKNGQIQTAASHRPDYLRLSQAERERKEAKTGKIRRMESGDLEQVAAIEADAFSMPWSKQAFADALAMENQIFLTTVCQGKVAGYGGLSLAADEGEIINIAVAIDCRRRGIAGRMLEELLQRARIWGAKQVFLEVRASNEPAKGLYEKYGFQPVGLRKNYYAKPLEDALVMRCQLADI